MPLDILDALVGAAATAVLAALAVRAGALTLRAGVVATVFGIVIVWLGGFPFLALLVLFVVASALSTRYRFDEKRRREVQEGTTGERGVSNVLAHIVVPTSLVLVGASLPAYLPADALALLYTSALAFGASDTFASEFGVLAGSTRSLLTGRTVRAGTNGGVSALGEVAALGGALTTAAVGLGLFALFRAPVGSAAAFVALATIAGLLACQIDSLLGELLENRGLLTKGGTNALGMLASVAIAAALAWAVGGVL